jgi:hypothetical protein|tara:strand:- start:22360 stop:22608 length:249 start_codon:yes stop_codon:yes gene_type:complete
MTTDYNLLPECPTVSDVREFLSEQMGELFARVAADRCMTSGDTSPDWEQQHSDTLDKLAHQMVWWLEVNDNSGKIPHWGIEP